MNNKKLTHKETFSQSPYGGAPFHVVVQYWDETGALHAAYFKDAQDAQEFEMFIEEQSDE